VSVTRFSVFKNKLLEKIFGSKREEVTGHWRKNLEDCHDLYSSSNIWVINSRRMRRPDMWYMWGRKEIHIWFWWGNLKERHHLEDKGTDGHTILKYL
jgi:hypothetical protein